jgi:hypothetical protein
VKRVGDTVDGEFTKSGKVRLTSFLRSDIPEQWRTEKAIKDRQTVNSLAISDSQLDRIVTCDQ